MKHYDWDNVLQYMDDELLEEALAPAGKKGKAGPGRRVYRTLLIAAIIAFSNRRARRERRKDA